MSSNKDMPGGPGSQASIRAEPGIATFWALVSITFIGPFSIHMFFPALPHIRAAFATDAAMAQLTFSIAMLSMSAATLFYGTLSDRLGRLPVVIGGLSLFSAGATLAGLAQSIEVLIAARALQGVGAACGMVMARAIARDLYGAHRLGQMIAYITAAYVVAPMIAPLIGGTLADGFGWQSILIVPAAFGIFAIFATVPVIGETKPKDLRPEQGVLRGVALLLTKKRFILFALNPAFGTAGFFSLNSGAVYLMAETMQRPASEFGLYFILGSIGYLTGNYLSGFLSRWLSGQFLIVTGSLVTLGGGLVLVGSILLIGLHPLCLFIPSAILSFGQGFSMPHAQAQAIRLEPALTGTASGLVVFLQLFIGAIATQIAGALTVGTPYPLIAVVMTTASLAAITGIGAVRYVRRQGELF